MSEANKLRKETLSEKELSAELDAAEQLATEAEADAEENTEAPDHADQEDDADDADDESSAVEATLPDSRIEEMIEEAGEEVITATRAELQPVIEALLFVADEPLTFRQLGKILGDVDEKDVRVALEELVTAYEAREGGLEIREIAGGWRISTRPQHHEFIRKYLRSKPSAKLSLPALETLAVIAYKQPVTIPEILEIRGVSSSSAIRTLLEKRLIITKGRKETVGRPMMYGTSKEFMLQFGLKDLTELPSIEDFEDLTG